MAETSKEADELATVVTEGSDKLPEWQKLQRIDRIWGGGLTVAASLLRLTTTIIGVEGLSLEPHRRKLRIGILGGLVVAMQSIGNAFPVK